MYSLIAAVLVLVQAPAAQNPSPMVEHTRRHARVRQETPSGRREALETGTLFVPRELAGKRQLPLIVHFHSAPWLVEAAAARLRKAAVVPVQIGSGSGVYARAFADPRRFPALLEEAARRAPVHFSQVYLSAWSAGYGAVREILKQNPERITGVLLLDGLHTGYAGGAPGPLESRLETENLEAFVSFAREAAAGRKRFVVTHSEIFPGTFASTTETADYLLSRLGLARRPVLKWGPMGMQQLSEARRGNFRMAGFAGNSAPDHVDQLHGLAEFWNWLVRP